LAGGGGRPERARGQRAALQFLLVVRVLFH